MLSKFGKFLLSLGFVLVVLTLSYASLTRSVAGSEHAYTDDNIWTWTGVNGYVRQIVTSPLIPGIVYALVDDSTFGPGILKSTDGGNTWSNIAQPDWALQSRRLAVADNAPNVLYAATFYGVYRTTDSGTTWQLVNTAYDPYGIAVSPIDWREVYISSKPFNTMNTIISKTMDGGATWTTVGVFDSYDSIFDDNELSIAPSAPNTLIYTVEQAKLYKTTDAGQSWSPLNTDFGIVSLAFDPKNSSTIYAGSNVLGGWKSTDGGSSWRPLANGLQPGVSGFVIDPDNTQVIHAANGSAGVLESIDGGAAWTPINAGIQGLSVRSIAVASRRPLVMYAGLAGGGIWKMTRTTSTLYLPSVTKNYRPN